MMMNGTSRRTARTFSSTPEEKVFLCLQLIGYP